MKPHSARAWAIGWSSNTLSWLILAGGIITMILTADLAFLSDSPVPYMDQWWFIHRLHQFAALFPFKYLWEQHNEHRIVIPRLFYLADFYLFNANNRFLLVTVYLVQAAHLFLLCWIIGRLGKLTGNSWRTAAGIAMFCLFLPVQDSFTWGWEIAYILPFFCATVGVCAIARHSRSDSARWSWVALACLAALIGSFSLANGFLIWPLLCLTMAMFHARLIQIIATALLGAIALVVNGIGYQPVARTDPLEALHHPRELAAFIQQCFSISWPTSIAQVGIFLTWTALFTTFAGVAWLCWRTPQLPALIALVSLATFQIFTLAVIALGRINLGVARRYQTPALLFWAFFCSTCILTVARRQMQGALLLIQSAVVALMAMSALQATNVRREVQTRTQTLAIAAAAAATSVNDVEAISQLVTTAEVTFPDLNFLQQKHRALFNPAPQRALGHAISDFARAPGWRCDGQINAVQPIPDEHGPGARVTGYAWDRQRSRSIEQIVLVTDDVVIGVGNADSLVRTNGRDGGHTPRTATWRGFVPRVANAATLSAYGMLENETICTLGGTQTISADMFSPNATEAGLKDLVPIWDAAKGVPVIYDGTGTIDNNVLAIHSTGIDTQVFFSSPVRLNRFHTLVFKAVFEKKDTIELFFGRMVEGRGISGVVPGMRQWIYLFANVGQNRYWENEAEFSFRFDPTSAFAVGSTVRLAGVWGREAKMPPLSSAFEAKLSRDDQPR